MIGRTKLRNVLAALAQELLAVDRDRQLVAHVRRLVEDEAIAMAIGSQLATLRVM